MRKQMAAPSRIAFSTTAAARSPIFETVREHNFISPALDAKLQLTDRTDHQPSATRLIPLPQPTPCPHAGAT